MRRCHLCASLAVSAVVLAVAPAAAQLCKPTLALQEGRLTEVRNQQRTWTGVVAVDASRCATTSGRFEIRFTRGKETAPDLQFTEQFTWRAGQVEVTTDFWADEAVLDYSLGAIAPCECRPDEEPTAAVKR